MKKYVLKEVVVKLGEDVELPDDAVVVGAEQHSLIDVDNSPVRIMESDGTLREVSIPSIKVIAGAYRILYLEPIE